MKRVTIGSLLVVINVLTWVLISVVIIFQYSVLRIILGIPFILFFPGFTLMAALFPKKEAMSGTARLALSFGLSIAIVPLIGLILNYTPGGITLEPILYSVASFILTTSIITWLRQRRLMEHECLAFEFHGLMPGWGEAIRDKVFTVVMVVIILGTLGIIGFFIVAPKVGEVFTEFYILGQEGRTADYPRELQVGEEGRVIVGIVNHEGYEVNYRVEVLVDGKKSTEVGIITLLDEQRWEGEVNFVPESASDNQKVDFLLYMDEGPQPYLGPLTLWINVSS